jgi:hypothetical protein
VRPISTHDLGNEYSLEEYPGGVFKFSLDGAIAGSLAMSRSPSAAADSMFPERLASVQDVLIYPEHRGKGLFRRALPVLKKLYGKIRSSHTGSTSDQAAKAWKHAGARNVLTTDPPQRYGGSWYALESAPSDTLVVIDVQPDIKLSWPVLPAVLKLAEASHKVAWIYDTQFLEIKEEGDISLWLLENGATDELIDRLQFQPKEYGFLRSAMGCAPDSLIIKALQLMHRQGMSDSRELEPPILDEDQAIGLPDELLEFLRSLRSPVLVGGARNECLAEITRLMDAFNLDYQLGPSQAIYESIVVNPMKARAILAKILAEGLESHATEVLRDAGFSPGRDFYWSYGLNVEDPEKADQMIEILSSTPGFRASQVTFDPKTSKIIFGRVPDEHVVTDTGHEGPGSSRGTRRK